METWGSKLEHRQFNASSSDQYVPIFASQALVVENDATATRRRSTARGTSQRDNVRPLHSENVHGPSVECCSALTSKVMPLIDGGNPKQLRRLVRQKLVD